MRGKDREPDPCQSCPGITPAYAGKSTRPFSSGHENGDHPRVCGEKRKIAARLAQSTGSPPRMRGKAWADYRMKPNRGITPAYAGKSSFFCLLHRVVRDHPRVCGEKGQRPDSREQNQGSPPRMRGKGCGGHSFLPFSGITPAYAGKRLKRSHSIGHFSCILCLFHSVLHRASVSGGSRAGPCAPPCLPAQNAIPV